MCYHAKQTHKGVNQLKINPGLPHVATSTFSLKNTTEEVKHRHTHGCWMQQTTLDCESSSWSPSLTCEVVTSGGRSYYHSCTGGPQLKEQEESAGRVQLWRPERSRPRQVQDCEGVPRCMTHDKIWLLQTTATRTDLKHAFSWERQQKTNQSSDISEPNWYLPTRRIVSVIMFSDCRLIRNVSFYRTWCRNRCWEWFIILR